MRFVSYQDSQGPAWGVLTAHGVVDSRALGEALPASLLGFIQQCADTPGRVQHIASLLAAAPGPAQPLASLSLDPCIAHPGKVICLGVNYHDHAKEGGNTVADYPVLFLRCDTSLLAHGASLKVPRDIF
jgi:acylpyruvate hydrolase